MKDFDIYKIGKEMPYEAPDEKFFEEFTEDLLAKVAPKPKMRFSLGGRLAPLWGIAAALAVVLTITLRHQTKEAGWDNAYWMSESLDESIDAYLSNLSDEELAYIAAESSYHDDFYSSLPTE